MKGKKRVGGRYPFRNIFRVLNKAFRGYKVYVKRGGHSRVIYVSDKIAGGRKAALREAVRVREKMLRALPPLTYVRTWTANNTGVPGVTRIADRTRQGTLAPRYSAFWVHAGRRRTRAFSVLKYGERGAFLRAIEARRLGVRASMETEVRRLGFGKVPDELPGLGGDERQPPRGSAGGRARKAGRSGPGRAEGDPAPGVTVP